MCGIAGYYNPNSTNPAIIVKNMLGRMTHRGYDSWGYYSKQEWLRSTDPIEEHKTKPKDSYFAIGHTRWATHGRVSIENAHPVNIDDWYVVHNGTLSGFNPEDELFDIDTQEIAYQLNRGFLGTSISMFTNAIKNLKKTYKHIGSFLAVHKYSAPIFLYCDEGNPLYLGYDNGTYISSDINAFPIQAESIEEVLPDTILEIGDKRVKTIRGNCRQLSRKTIEEYEQNEESYMLNEIKQQPGLIENYKPIEPFPYGDGRHTITGCGSSYYAGLLGAYFMQHEDVDCTVQYASEAQSFPTNAINLFISQSGDTKDVVSRAEFAKIHKARTFSIHNNPNSKLARITDNDFYIGAGEERGVAATKTFLMNTLLLYSWVYGKTDLTRIEKAVEEIIERSDEVRVLAEKVCEYKNALFLGSCNFYPIALEGALKLKEIAYIHSEGMPSSEVKHGPIALIDEKTISIVVGSILSPESKNNINQIKARGGEVIVAGNDSIFSNASFQFPPLYGLDTTLYSLCSLLGLVFVQLLAYHCAKLKGLDVDKPRGLSKVITV